MPQALLPSWPWCWWVAVVLDHYSRRVVAFEVFRSQPSAEAVCDLLERCVVEQGNAPKYIVTDQGSQFRNDYRAWCQRRGVKPRFGAIGQHGSIAVIERCIRSLKDEGLRKILVPLRHNAMIDEVQVMVDWYNSLRPHSALAGATPNEVYDGRCSARSAPRFEPRALYPVAAPATVRAPAGTKLELVAQPFRGRRHLPVVELRAAA